LFNPLVARVYDSREHTQLAAGATRTIPIGGVDGIPSVENGLSAVAAELHVIAPDGTHVVLEAWDSDYAEPGTAAVTSAESSLSLVAPGVDNAIKVKNASSTAIDLAVDVEGWFRRFSVVPAQMWAPMAAVQVPTVDTTQPGGLEYFYADGSGILHTGYQPLVDSFDNVEWNPISGTQEFVGQPSLTVRPDKTMQLSVLSRDAGVRTRVQTFNPSPAWPTPFVNVGGTFASAPVVTALPDNSLVAFAVDGVGRLWARRQSGSAQYWQQLGNTAGFVGSPTVVATATGVRVFVTTTGGTVSTATYANGVLSAWTDLGGVGVTDRPAAVVKPGFHAQVVIRQGDGSIVTKAQADDESFPAAWAQVGTFVATGAPAAVFDSSTGQVEILARGATDNYIYSSGETFAGSGVWRDWVVVSLDPNDPTHTTRLASYTDPTIATYSGSQYGNCWLAPFRVNPAGALGIVRLCQSGLAPHGAPQTSSYALPAQ
jgi:hypothetical protein